MLASAADGPGPTGAADRPRQDCGGRPCPVAATVATNPAQQQWPAISSLTLATVAVWTRHDGGCPYRRQRPWTTRPGPTAANRTWTDSGNCGQSDLAQPRTTVAAAAAATAAGRPDCGRPGPDPMAPTVAGRTLPDGGYCACSQISLLTHSLMNALTHGDQLI